MHQTAQFDPGSIGQLVYGRLSDVVLSIDRNKKTKNNIREGDTRKNQRIT